MLKRKSLLFVVVVASVGVYGGGSSNGDLTPKKNILNLKNKIKLKT